MKEEEKEKIKDEIENVIYEHWDSYDGASEIGLRLIGRIYILDNFIRKQKEN